MSAKAIAWIVDDDRSIRWVLQKALEAVDITVKAFESGDLVLEQLKRGTDTPPDVLVSDIRMPGLDGLQLLSEIQQNQPDLPVIIMTAYSDLDSAVSVYEGGAFEYLPKPFDVDEAVDLVQRAVTHHRQQHNNPAGEMNIGSEIIGEAPAMQEVFRAIGRLARSNITVLINGESGTGKELVAHALHKHSPRRQNPFIALNMAAIPKELLESELFGHEKGAFTGAHVQRKGRFEQADGGTLFLDEIGDMPLELQTRLLRVLSDGEFFRVGGHSAVKADVRIIAATHQNLEQQVERGDFREDLFHRLNVIRIHIPSLRERREDIPALVAYFLNKAARELNMGVKSVSPEVERYLSQLPWPGNVRQLENTSRWLTVMSPGQVVQMDDLPMELTSDAGVESIRGGTDWQQLFRQWAANKALSGQEGVLADVVPMIENLLMEVALEKTAGKRQEAAKLLGWGRNTLTRKLKEN
ncbi:MULTISPECIES: nitrogen regulation protein NR(I) [unclassified Methylophaga]|uniref:nitrogen regulation protein NR(I) n=1 Tax=unclassified Methylophaga TaxID=2629249 RepID=UPI000C95F31A|nr:MULTISPECIES: nitrogen regulation protein NR(I) [unclassified Methylophaga]MAY18232.1 nitrogen regulation protein NR(I) [Methylophaga sp.]MBN47582.1 nitrogen regulation protein NR(I) [Methylophaga sp.]HAO23807.1 nitrogen regulation protein NR(I) [Methylophaga sp.]HCD04633.1 nitrogen regulation protein NR(I) [Methylophaga sp.]